MTPKEKAKELFKIFALGGWPEEHAISAVDEIIKAIDWHEFETPNEELNYWNKVKEEIQKL